MLRIEITPVSKPRQTRSDVWRTRPAVMKYRAFADELRLKMPQGLDLNGSCIKFIVEMPKSWSKKKRAEMCGTPHKQTPDLDNFLKALLDAYMGEDCGIWSLGRLEKIWGITAAIEISAPWEQI